jgi:hypothetical protein
VANQADAARDLPVFPGRREPALHDDAGVREGFAAARIVEMAVVGNEDPLDKAFGLTA